MSDKNFKVKNGIDAVGPITISPSSNSIDGLIINTPTGGKAIRFIRNGTGEVGSIDEWGGLVTSGGIQVVQPWYTRSPGIEAQSFFWAGSSTRSAAGFGGTSTGTNPVIYISSHSTGTNDLTQWLKPDNTIVAKVDYLGNITANDLTLAGNLTVNGTTTNLNSTNLIIEDKNIIIADVATPSDTTADGAGITVKGATDKTFNWVQSTKSFTTSDPLIINNTSTTTVPLIAKGYASQTANHFEVQDSAGNKMFVVNPPAGTLQPLEYFFVRPGGTGGTATIGTNSYSFRVVAAGGNSVSFGTPGGGTSLQVVTSDTFNRYKIIGSGTGIAPTFTTDGNDANVNMYVTAKGAGKIGINTTSPTGYVHAVSSSSSTVGLIVEGASGQTSTNIFEVQRAGGGDPSFNVSHNYIDLNRNTTAAASMTVYGPNAGAVPLYVKGRASQTANLQEWQNSAGGVLSYITASGALRVNSSFGGTQAAITAGSAATVGVIVRGAASQTADLQQWQDSSGTVLTTIDSSGKFVIGRGAQLASAVFTVQGNTSTYSPDNTSALANRIIFLRGNTGGNLMALASKGDAAQGVAALAITNGGFSTEIIGFGYNGNIYTNIQSASTVGLTIKAAASQTANLQEWQNSSGTMLSKIDKDGIITVPAINVVGQSISSNTTMIAGYRYFVDTSASRTLTLPSSATIGDEIQIFDSTNTAGTNNITINSNNGKIEGVVESYIIDVNGAAIVMTYTGSTYGWKVRM